MTRVDLNADMGESYGSWVMGNDAALLDIVTSANVACGFHAGDPDVMAVTMRLAVQKGAGIGAHPGFADLQGFGRRRLVLSDATLANLVRYQLGAAEAIATAAGGAVRHLKLHGALSNMACEDEAMARVAYEAALDIRDLRSMLDLLRLVRRTAVQTVVRAVTTAVLLALLAGVAIKLKVFGNGP